MSARLGDWRFGYTRELYEVMSRTNYPGNRRDTAVLFVLTKTLYSIVALSCHAETRIKEQIRDASTAVSFAGIGG